MKPDDVCKEYGTRPIKLQVRDLGDVILVEGTREALEFLGKVFIAQSAANDDGFEIGPRGPGEYFFDPRAEKGFYIHRMDDTEPSTDPTS
ncbi:MAG TPA: hypothetical protein VHK90_11310 [Thermoanaerobaculia bacterium]|nr:hypothetical protein [Thermoanaerobaculia bacterium]